MPYGRLDVFWPEGIIRSFPLSEDNVSVGRSSGNTITLENNTISRYHFTIVHNADQVTLSDLDSANGTYIDGVKLVSNTPTSLYGGEEILIGNLRIIYHFTDDSPTQSIAPVEDTTQRIALAARHFSIDLQGPEQGVAPGAHISAELSIENTSETDQRYRVEVTGLPPEWARIDRPTPLVEAGETTFVLINFKPTRRFDSQPGEYPVTIRVYSQNGETDYLETALMLRVLPFHGFGMALDSTQALDGEALQLHLHNQGSEPLPLTLRARSEAAQVDLTPARVTLNPGQRLTVQGVARLKNRGLVGAARRHPVDVIAQAGDHSGFIAATRAYVVERPLIPTWGPLALVGAAGLLALVIMVGVLIALLTPPPNPHLALFEVNSTQIARGASLELRWAATDVARLTLRLNGTPIPLEAGTTSHTIDTTALPGEVNLLLEGRNGDAVDVRGEQVYIYEPLTLQRFSVAPERLVRYVVQPISVDWYVTGAVSTRVLGLEAFNNTPLVINGPEGLFIDLVGIPVEPLTLTLIAEDVAGNRLEERVVLTLINPECRALAGPVPLHVGPALAHQVVHTIPSDASVVVDAQDPSGEWLRIAGLPGGVPGWGPRGAFACADTFRASDLRIDPNAPPPPTAAPTGTSTPNPTATPITTIIPPITPTGVG